MSSLLVALPVICCLLIPAAIYVAVLVFRRPGKQSQDSDGQIRDLRHPIDRDLRN